MSSYIGGKGYSIYKECLSIQEQQWIRKELCVRPYIPKAPVQPPSFPIYREGHSKIYIPRFFGNDTYGEADEDRLPKGTAISLRFTGNLRDYQQKIASAYLDQRDEVGCGGLLEIPCGRGKTVIALSLIASLGVKTLVIVHKSFLLNQWIERIQQFLPGAKIGRIQGQIIDIENKDIVIGMLQSLSMKEYPEDLFQSFGLTVVDECHHISSEVFSRSLSKIVTRHVLGLSATMERKDGLTKVFKMFLGPVAYKEDRESDDSVLVKAIQYDAHDEEFNETIQDYRGNPAYSQMITKLCEYGRRSDFIVSVIKQELSIRGAQQIMILSQNKSLLVYLQKAIQHKNIATVGYYVGGMKEAALKESENCKIILATYAMAAEALDIKTLTTLILATPRTDITQAVGRILRMPHERPLVVDIIDTHDVFQNQWKKRRAFYKKQGYNITQTTSINYPKNIWQNDAVVKKKVKSKKKTCLITLPGMCSED